MQFAILSRGSNVVASSQLIERRRSGSQANAVVSQTRKAVAVITTTTATGATFSRSSLFYTYLFFLLASPADQQTDRHTIKRVDLTCQNRGRGEKL